MSTTKCPVLDDGPEANKMPSMMETDTIIVGMSPYSSNPSYRGSSAGVLAANKNDKKAMLIIIMIVPQGTGRPL